MFEDEFFKENHHQFLIGLDVDFEQSVSTIDNQSENKKGNAVKSAVYSLVELL